eukprot:474321_1
MAGSSTNFVTTMSHEVLDDVWTNSNISVMAIGALYCLAFTVSLFYSYCANKKIINSIVIIANIHALSWLIHFIASMTTYITQTKNQKNNRDDIHDIENYIISIMIIIHPITFYITMTLRIYHAFDRSIYQLNKYEFSIITFSALITIGATMIEQICWIIIIANNTHTHIIPIDNIITICLWIRITFDIVTRLILVYFFTHKLFGAFMLQTHPNENVRLNTKENVRLNTNQSNNEQTCNENARLNTKEPSMIRMNTFQGKILNLIQKITLLSVISILPLTISRLLFVFVLILFANDGVLTALTHRDWLSFNALQCVAIFIEILAIVLTFGFNSHCYKYLCKYCDLACNKCCVVAVQRKIMSASEAASN